MTTRGYRVEMIEKYHRAGGRLNLLEKNGFKFDMAPTFFSMSYEFKELVDYCQMDMPFEFVELDPLYSVHFEGDAKSYLIYKDLKKLALEFQQIEPDFERKMKRFLEAAGQIFHDTENVVIQQNFNSLTHYLLKLTTVPIKHAPKMFLFHVARNGTQLRVVRGESDFFVSWLLPWRNAFRYARRLHLAELHRNGARWLPQRKRRHV